MSKSFRVQYEFFYRPRDGLRRSEREVDISLENAATIIRREREIYRMDRTARQTIIIDGIPFDARYPDEKLTYLIGQVIHRKELADVIELYQGNPNKRIRNQNVEQWQRLCKAMTAHSTDYILRERTGRYSPVQIGPYVFQLDPDDLLNIPGAWSQEHQSYFADKIIDHSPQPPQPPTILYSLPGGKGGKASL